MNNRIIPVVLKETQSKNRSDLYSLYFWMHIHYQANSHLHHDLSLKDEPSMHELLPEHQSELILHMIEQGYALKNWYINSNELTITDMLIDKKQVDALEQLLQQGQYQFCLKADNQPIEEGKIYISVDSEGLHYTVLDRNGTRQVALIAPEALECPLAAPLTLDQLQSLPKLLEQIAKSCNLGTSIERLILNNIRFTKKYNMKVKDGHIFENIFYVRTDVNSIQYSVIAPSGKTVVDTISYDELGGSLLAWSIE